MRLILVLLVLAFAAAGAIFGALNSETVAYDFYFATWSVPKGTMLIAAVLLGWLLGGALVYFGLVLRLRGRLRAQERALARTDSAAAGSNLSPTDSELNR